MLKFFVAAVFGICTLPCLASAQDIGSVMTESTVAPVEVPAAPAAPAEAVQVYDAGPMVESAAGDCGCDAAPAESCGCDADPCAPRTRKKLALKDVQLKRCRLKLTCTTDCCGCPKRKLVREEVTVCRKRLTLVDAPARERCGCAGGRLRGLLSKLGSCGCKASCGCEEAPAEESCGCGEAPAVEPCGCGG